MNAKNRNDEGCGDGLQPFPLTEQEWREVRDRLGFTDQQAMVAALVLRAACDKKIAYELGLRLPTVRTHLRRVYEKAGVQDRAELIVRVFIIAREKER
jgi:DNA-binding NarL/FixJ family response regulator